MPNDRIHRFQAALAFTGTVVLFVIIVLASDPLPQEGAYHQLADRRSRLGVANFFDVASNLPFAAIGLAGLGWCLKHRPKAGLASWSVFFAGLLLVALGSCYYHLQPNNATLLWDRLPMTISFMALLVAVLTENLWPRLEPVLLPGAVLLGLASVLYWRYADDLRLYAFVQFGALFSIPLVLAMGRPRYTHRSYLIYGLMCYVLAKATEMNDRAIFLLTDQGISGHTIKHLLAGAATYCLYLMLRRRSALPS